MEGQTIIKPRPEVHIALAAYSFAAGNGGIARVARLMALTLTKQNVKCQLLEYSGSNSSPLFGLERRACNDSKLQMLLEARRLSRKNTHFIFDSPNFAQLTSKLWPRKPKVMTFCHGIDVWENARRPWLQAAQNSDILLCNSNYTKQRAQNLHSGLNSLQCCPLATEEDSLPEQLDSSTSSENLDVIIVARMATDERYKGHQELIEAWPKVTQRIPLAHLKIIGVGDDQARLKAFADQGGASKNITFLGKVSELELQQLYQNSALFAMPSRNEGFGLVYIEAMRNALPVLTSLQDAGQELIKDGQTGITVDLDQTNELANKLINYLGDPQKLKEIGLAGQKHWQQQHTFTSFEKKFELYLNAFINSTD